MRMTARGMAGSSVAVLQDGIDRLLRALAHEVGAKGRERRHHLGEDLGRGGDHLSAVQEVAVAGEIADEPARFLDQQAAGRDVPRVEADLPEAVVEAGGDVREIERGRAGPAQAGRLLDHRLHHPEVRVEIAAVAKREAGADEAVAQMLALRDADAPVVEERAAARATP